MTIREIVSITLYSMTDIILKPANNYFGEIFDIDDDDLNNLPAYQDCLVLYKTKKYFVKFKDFERHEKKTYIKIGNKIIAEIKNGFVYKDKLKGE